MAINRKPDFETESFRAWNVKDSEKEKVIKETKEEHPIIIKQGDMELQLNGFTKAIDRKTDKVVFAFKFKHEGKLIMYYIPDKLSKENQEKVKNWFEEVSPVCTLMNYQLENVSKFLKNIESSKKHLEKGI